MGTSLNPQIRRLIYAWANDLKRQPTFIGVGQQYLVPSESERDGFYVVGQLQYTDKGNTMRGWVCSCPAFRFSEEEEFECKHIKAVKANLPQIGGPSSTSTTASELPPKTKVLRSKPSSKRSAVGSKKVHAGDSSKTSASSQSRSSTQKRRSATRRTSKSPGASTTKKKRENPGDHY